MLPSAKPQYSNLKSPTEVGAMAKKAADKVAQGATVAKKTQDAYKTGKYRQLRKGAEEYVAAVRSQEVKEKLKSTAQEFAKVEGEKQFMFENKPVPKGISSSAVKAEGRTTQTAGPLYKQSPGNTGANTKAGGRKSRRASSAQSPEMKLQAGNLSMTRVGSRRVVATPMSGPSLSRAQSQPRTTEGN
jgi:hypothetical protein